MSSKTEICNLALSHLGIGQEITSLETEKSVAAQTCRRFYETVRKISLRDFSWPFATRIAALALVEEDPNDEWAYSYRYPTDCLKIRKLLSGVRNEGRDDRVSYKIASDDEGQLIYTDREEAEMEYTVNATDPEKYTPDFTMAMSLRLANYIAPRVTGGDPFKVGDRAIKLYGFEIGKAEVSAVNEQQDDRVPEGEFIRARE